MFQNKYLQEESENYYIPFVDLMSGVVFILMIILSAELMNIKYPETKVAVDTPISQAEQLSKDLAQLSKDLETIELFKKKLISSISSYLNKNKIKNKVSEDYNSILVYAPTVFDKESLSLTPKGKVISSKISEAFSNCLFLKSEQSDVFKKYVEHINSISINVFSPQKEKSKNSAVSKTFTFYGQLVNLNQTFLTFSNSYNQRLIRISDTRSMPESLLKDLGKNTTDVILLNFEFFYPQSEKVLW